MHHHRPASSPSITANFVLQGFFLFDYSGVTGVGSHIIFRFAVAWTLGLEREITVKENFVM